MADKKSEIDSLIAERLDEGWSLERLARHGSLPFVQLCVS